ncbi:MAG TPA: response regulator transcription factor [Acidimicrobiia bacterium]|nr:response regulator transcription factor [Acidimicrobiia bacterium]
MDQLMRIRLVFSPWWETTTILHEPQRGPTANQRTMGTILVVEDDDRLRSALRLALRDEGFDVETVPDAESGLAALSSMEPDLILVDIMLPGVSGFDFCRTVRQSSFVPIIMVTARDDSHDVVAGLEAGADDYVTKPFVVKELAARIRALLRRTRTTETESADLDFGHLVISPEQGRVTKDGVEIPLTRIEFLLLCELASSPNRVRSRDALLESVWGYDYFGDGRVVDAHVRRLRKKIEPDPSNPMLVVTVRGLGYRFEAPSA